MIYRAGHKKSPACRAFHSNVLLFFDGCFLGGCRFGFCRSCSFWFCSCGFCRCRFGGSCLCGCWFCSRAVCSCFCSGWLGRFCCCCCCCCFLCRCFGRSGFCVSSFCGRFCCSFGIGFLGRRAAFLSGSGAFCRFFFYCGCLGGFFCSGLGCCCRCFFFVFFRISETEEIFD